MQELLAGAYGRGLEAGFSMSDFDSMDPAKAMDIFVAGIEEGQRKRELGQGEL